MRGSIRAVYFFSAVLAAVLSCIIASPVFASGEDKPATASVAPSRNLFGRLHPAGSCGESSGRRCSLRMRATIKSGDDRKPPIGPHSHVQNASAMNTASAFSSSLRPMMVAILAQAYSIARAQAIAETGFADEKFSEACPFTADEVMSGSFYPEA